MRHGMLERCARGCAAAALGINAALLPALPLAAPAGAPGFMAPAAAELGVIAAFAAASASAAAEPVAAAAAEPAGVPAQPPGATSQPGGAVAADTAAQADDIRDIRGPKYVFPAWLLPALLAGALLLAAGGYALWRWKRRRRAPRPLLPYEIALQRLEEIRRLLDPSTVREFSIAVSDIVRQHIEAEFNVTATHRTTEEFLHDLLETSDQALATHRGLLAEFLNRCDMAKFAGMALSRQIMESLHQSARSFVIETAQALSAKRVQEAAAPTHAEGA